MAKRAAKNTGQKPRARELPPVGTELVGRYQGQEVSAHIVKDDDRGGAPAVECRVAYCLFAAEAVALLRRQGFDANRLEGGWPEWWAEGRSTGR